MSIGWKLAVVYAIALALGVPWWLPLLLGGFVVAWGFTLGEAA
jgi:hypothetical protein